MGKSKLGLVAQPAILITWESEAGGLHIKASLGNLGRPRVKGKRELGT